MPTQRMVVRVPFTDNQNDARIFCSHGSQLRPALSGWHGKPPEEGDETTLFLEGKNFSIHDTHVIAGGKPATAVLISRQLLQVTIPRDACPTPSAQGTSLLDINVATPNGVSNHLLIRMRAPDARHKLHHEEKTTEPLKDGPVALNKRAKVDACAATAGHHELAGPGKTTAARVFADPKQIVVIPAP